MIDLDELWVGDTLRVISSGRYGRYVGKAKDGRLRIQRDGKIFLVNAKNVELVTEEDKPSIRLNIEEEDVDRRKRRIGLPNSTIDLHIEILQPDLVNAIPERIVDFQIKAFESYIDEAIKKGLRTLTIIHGKGKGVLKAHIETYLRSIDEIAHFHAVNQGGATEVYLK